MLLRLDSESGVPFYQQVVQQVRRLVASGALAPGDRLPTVRELAAELVLNPNTVARAYQDLEREGVVETRRGQGTFACAPSSRLSRAEARQIVAALLDRALLEARHLGLSPAEVLDLLKERTEETHEQPIAS
ncbi:MAG: GntR family transcriptional regulator [Armatimonadetes bacterium]|nr:GntR family transcriptional regulator [Armatimonadota bacterium]